MLFAEQSEVQKISQMALDPSTQLSQIILHPSIFAILRMNDSNVVNYMCNNIEQLLKSAFGDISSAEATSCFEILLMMIPEIAQSMIKNGTFYNFANDLLSFPMTDPVVGRLSNLTCKLMKTCLPGALDSCGFLLKLLKYCDNSGVSDLFTTMMTFSPELECFHRWLANRNVAGALVNQIKEIEIDSIKKNDFLSADNERLCAYYSIIENSIKSPILKNFFASKAIIEILSYKKEFICFIEDQRWSAVKALIEIKPSHDLIEPLIKLGKKFISNDLNQIHQYHALIVNILDLTLPRSIESTTISQLLKLMTKFPNCSHFHLSVSSFIEKALSMKCVDDSSVLQIASYAYKTSMNSPTGSVAHATSMKIIIYLYEYAKKHKKSRKILEKINGYVSYVKDQLKPYIRILESDYGKGSKKFSFFIAGKKIKC